MPFRSDSYWAQYYQTWDRYFRETGISSALIITEADYPEEKTYSIINSFLDKVGYLLRLLRHP